MEKFDLNIAVTLLYWNHTSAWVFSCKFATYPQRTFSQEHVQEAALLVTPKQLVSRLVANESNSVHPLQIVSIFYGEILIQPEQPTSLNHHPCRAEASNFINKEALAQVFSCEFCEISRNTVSTDHLSAAASG